MEKTTAQLALWGLRINNLAARAQLAGAQPSFDALMHVDELKALHAIAAAKLAEFKAQAGPGRRRLEAELKRALNDLEVALEKPSL